MSYSPEQIGRAVSRRYTDRTDQKLAWDDSGMHRGLEQRHEVNPANGVELAEILPALEKQYRGGRAGQLRRELVEHEAGGGEHIPQLIDWACSVRYRYEGDVAVETIPGQVVQRFPEPAHLIAMARERNNQVLGLTLEQARMDNALAHVYRRASRELKAQESAARASRPRRLIRTIANRPYLRGKCASCDQEVFHDQAVIWDRNRRQRWHTSCPPPPEEPCPTSP